MKDKKFLLMRIETSRKNGKSKYVYVLMNKANGRLKRVHEKKYERMKAKGKC